MNAIDTQLFAADVPLDLATKVDEFAVRLARSRSSIMSQALASWVDQEEQFDRLTWEALREVDSGALHDHDEMQAWIDNLGKVEAIHLSI
jgi:predicted transcriptional regulator